MKLWLDDIRPAPEGWTHVKTVQDAITFLKTGQVTEASLDHDLGACDECLRGMTEAQWLVEAGYKSMPNCDHFGTGYNLVCWMEENNVWPSLIRVHSSNPVGRQRMQQVINKHYYES